MGRDLVEEEGFGAVTVIDKELMGIMPSLPLLPILARSIPLSLCFSPGKRPKKKKKSKSDCRQCSRDTTTRSHEHGALTQGREQIFDKTENSSRASSWVHRDPCINQRREVMADNVYSLSSPAYADPTVMLT